MSMKCELFFYILCDRGDSYTTIVQTTRVRKCGSDRCNLCLAEKFHILTSKNNGLLNKCSELISKCRQINKHLLTNTDR